MIRDYQPRYYFEDQSPVYGSYAPSIYEEDAAELVKSKKFTDVVLLLEEGEEDGEGGLYKIAYEAKGINVLHFPIEDYGTPTYEELHKWIPQIVQIAQTPNRKILIHCQGGCGRTGLIVACTLAILKKISAEEAIIRTRKCNPEAIETSQQRSCVAEFVRQCTENTIT